MSIKRGGKGRRRAGRRPGFFVESLERRRLLTTASETFTGPSLAGLITPAEHGKSPLPAIDRMLNALESQLKAGPLADLNSGAAAGNGFIAESQALEASFEQFVDQKFLAALPNVDQVLKLEGQRVVAELSAYNQQDDAGLIINPQLDSSARSAIDSLVDGPILPLGTPLAAISGSTKEFRSELYNLADRLADGSLTLARVNTTLGAEAEAYRADVHAAAQVEDLRVSGEADAKINALEDSSNAIAQGDASGAFSQLSAAIKTFVSSVLDTDGLFGPRGAYSKAPKDAGQAPRATTGRVETVIGSISGTTTSNGVASLTATLTSFNGSPIAGENVVFSLDGGFAGVASTNFVGVATLGGVPNADAVGLDSGGIVASYPGDTNNLSSRGTGDLTVNPITTATTLSNASGTAVVGGTATLTATLEASGTNQAIAGQTVAFTLDGTSVGSAVTASDGIATLTGVATTDGVGTDTGGVIASFGGSAGDLVATSVAGNLVVSSVTFTLGSIAGTAQFGGTATLSATVDSAGASQGVAGQSVEFALDGTDVGTAVSGSTGVATLTGVATSDSAGTDTGGIIARIGSVAGGTGNLVVAPATTVLGNVSATSSFGGTATLRATLTSAVTTLGVVGETVAFMLDGASVGTAVTDSNGIATLSAVTATNAVGTDTGGVAASFAGDLDYAAASNSGNLIVSRAGTTLGNVSGTAFFGGTATLTASLTSAVNNQAIAGQSVTFTLDGTSVGSAVTNGNGIATLTGVATTDAVGTDTGGVMASFGGSTSYGAAANATGNLVVSQPQFSLTGVSGTDTFGGTATLSATLDTSATGQGQAGQSVVFTLDKVAVGTAVTNSSGVATLTGVATTDAVGTDTGGIIASFPGSTNGTGNLVVGQAGTALTGVSGTAPVGGPATLMATLLSSVTNQALVGQTVSFTLDNKAVGTAVTDDNGVATLTGVATTDSSGVDIGGVVVNYAGDTDYKSSQGTGNLSVV